MSPKRMAGILILILLMVPACHKKPAKIAVRAPAPTALEIGNGSFEAGQYESAAISYETYLKENPDAADRDQALFKLGITYGLLGKEPQDFSRAQNQLRTLVTQFPQSRYRPEAEYILSLQTDVEKVRLDLRTKEDDLQSRDIMIRDKDEKLRDRDERIRERDEKIRRLTQELERLKKIDMERRPSAPPQ